MTVDHDGKIRMDCSSPYAMAGLVGLKDRFDVAFGNDPDADRHGIVTPSAGLMNPNHYLAVAIRYLLAHRPRWPATRGGRQDAGQQRHDRPRRRRARPPAAARCRSASSGSSPGCSTARSASAARRAPARASCAATARVWTTDKDGLIMDLLAAEITAAHRQGSRRALPRARRREFGAPCYTRIDAPATPEQKARLAEALARGGQGDRRWPASRSPRKLTRAPGQRRADRRPEGRRPRTAGSPRGRRAPRTSTRSTPRASATSATSTRSSPRRRQIVNDALAATAGIGDDTMKATAELHDLGQSLWLDNITRDLLDERHARALHRRALGHRAHLEPDDLRPRDQEQHRLRRRDPRRARAGQDRRGAVLRAGARGPDARRRPVPADPRAHRRRRRLGVARGVAAARLRHREHDRRGQGAASRARRGRTCSSRSRARRKGCRRSRRRSSPACRST